MEPNPLPAKCERKKVGPIGYKIRVVGPNKAESIFVHAQHDLNETNCSVV